jgi:hypothetical protein
LSAITHLFAGVPVSDLDSSIDLYARFFGRPPDSRVGEEVLWEVDEHAWLSSSRTRRGRARAGSRSPSPGSTRSSSASQLRASSTNRIETYSNDVRHVTVPDPDGNAIAFAEPPDTASASPRSLGTSASP